jgi:DNA-binding transcriptional ArsR family regulator
MPKKNQTIPEAFTPTERMKITSLEALKVLADPFRIQILESLAGPQTVKTVAQQLGVSPTKLYYHINMLEQHGLIRVVSTRVVSGILEKSYQITANSFEAAPSFASPNATLEDALGFMTSVLDAGKLEMRRAYNSGQFTMPTSASEAKPPMLLTRTILSLTEARAKKLRERISKLLKEFSDDQSAQTQDFSLTIAFHPTVPREIPSGSKIAKKARKS